jgi:predicted ArsR family transcriptional regulator
VLDSPDASAPDDVLTERSRARLFAVLSELGRAATTSELATAMRLHPNGVRRHLGMLESAGLVTRGRTVGTRGRPADTWAVAGDAPPDSRAPSGYRELSRWLARAIADGAHDPDEVRHSGRLIGRELASTQSDAESVEQALVSLGFAPRRRPGSDGRTRLHLGNCPYRDVAAENQPTICGLHHGMTEGLIDVLMPEAELTRFVAEDPRTAGCVIEIDEHVPASGSRTALKHTLTV